MLAIFLIGLAVVAVLICAIASTPRTFRDSPRPVLICAAHSDDCVILGAEYAAAAVERGLHVRIVYLTCSSAHPNDEIAQIRRKEAVAAWSALGVGSENLTFIDLAGSASVAGPAAQSPDDIAHATQVLEQLIISLPEGSSLIIPAQGESHVDHRNFREVSLRAKAASKRDDIIVYEAPEYNASLSLLLCTARTVRSVLRFVPFVSRIVEPYAGPVSFVNGGPGFVFRDTPNRLSTKKRLLKYFTSQDGDLLVQHFGYKTPYRRLVPSRVHEPVNGLRFTAFGASCDWSVLAFGILLLTIAYLIGREAAHWATLFSPALPADKLIFLLGGAIGTFYITRWVRGYASLETSMFVLAIALGLSISPF